MYSILRFLGGASPKDEAGGDDYDMTARCSFCGTPRSTGSTQAELAVSLRSNMILRTPAAFEAYAAVNRSDFMPVDEEEDRYASAYVDAAIFLGDGAQISAPHVHASALELAAESLAQASVHRNGAVRILDIGSGCGIMAVLLARLAESLCPVGGVAAEITAVEHVGDLVSSSIQNVARNHSGLLAANGGPLTIACADGRTLARGEQHAGAFDLVHVGCALERVEEWLVGLLAPGGRAVCPVGVTDAPQRLCAVDLGGDGKTVAVRETIRVMYVPLTSLGEQGVRARDWGAVVARCKANGIDPKGDDAVAGAAMEEERR